MPPSQNHLVKCIVYDIFSTRLGGASVSIVHSSGTLSGTTNSNGEYIDNLANLSSYSIGDSLSISASKAGEGSKTITTTIQSGGGQTEEITLEETQIVDGVVTYPNQAKIDKTILISYDKRDINRGNPLPVQSSEIDLMYNPDTTWTITRADSQPDYVEVLIHGTTYRRNFTYNSNGLLIRRSKWVKQ